MPHVALLGDSVFDNEVYVPRGADVTTRLRATLPAGWTVSLLAVDGGIIASVDAQMRRLPADATHLVLSVGGNDAIGHSGILGQPARSVAEVLDLLAEIRDDFEARYRRALATVAAAALPLTVCTIYGGHFEDARTQRLTGAALTVFNDVILRAAQNVAVGVIDLRHVCSEPSDFTRQIEPSAAAALKIARAVARAVGALDVGERRTTVVA